MGVKRTFDTQAEWEAGTFANLVAADGKLRLEQATGKALSFDGENDFVDLGSATSLNPRTGDYTIEAWIKTTSSKACMIYGSNAFAMGKYISFLVHGQIGCLRFLISSYSDSDRTWRDSSSAVNDGKWHHVAVTWKSSTKEVLIYIDGDLDVAASYGQQSTVGDVVTGQNYYIGVNMGNNRWFDGLIDDVRVWNIARTTQQIADNMNRELVGDETGLVGYWKFNEGEGSTAYDSAGSNHGTITGATWVDGIYTASGSWISPPLSLDAITEAAGSLLTAIATTPPGTSSAIKAGLSESAVTLPTTWAEQTPGQALSVISPGSSYAGKYLRAKIDLATTDVSKTLEVDACGIAVGQHDRRSIAAYADLFRGLAVRNAGRYSTGYAAQAMGRVAKTFDLHRAAIGFSNIVALSGWLLRKWERVWVPLGVFWSGDWHAPEDAVYAKTTGRDRLELLRSTNYSASQVLVADPDVDVPEIVFERDSGAVHPSTGAEIPSDIPIFMTFSGNKQGLLIEEGVTNLLTANQSSFETSSTVQAATRYTHERSAEWSKHGQYSQKLIRDSNETADAYVWYRCTILGQGFVVGTPFVAQAILYLPPGCWYIGKDITFRTRFTGGAQATGALTSKTFTLHEGENLLWGMDALDYADRTCLEYFIWEVGAGHRAPEGTVFYTDCHMTHVGGHLLSWAPGGEPRAGAHAHVPLPNPLPPEFGIGLSVRMLHNSTVKDGTFWQAGGYACFYDAAASKIKMTNGVVATEVGASWDAGDIIGIYAGRKDGKLFIQGKIAGETTGLIRVNGYVLSGIEEITIGSGGGGSGHVNGVVADFVLHDKSIEIDPIAYLSKVMGKGGK